MNSIDDKNLERAGELFDSILVPAAETIRERGGRTLPEPSTDGTSFWLRHVDRPLLRPAGPETAGESLARLWEQHGYPELVAVAVALDEIVTALEGRYDDDGPSPYIYAMF